MTSQYVSCGVCDIDAHLNMKKKALNRKKSISKAENCNIYIVATITIMIIDFGIFVFLN